MQAPDVSQWGEPDWGIKAPLVDGQGLRLEWALLGRHGDVLDEAPANRGMGPRGAVAEPNAPDFGFRITRKIDCWADDVPELQEDIERAVCQVMTFLVENEYVALYLPAKFIPRIDPHYIEVSLLLATQVKDEARHIEVYTKRALANGGGLQYVSASTQYALKSLMVNENYVKASFLLHLLGEGTFLDMLKLTEDVAPDPVTKEILVRTRQDETRHVGYGVSHIRYLLEQDPSLSSELLEAAEERASFLRASSGANPFLQRSLAVLAGGGSDEKQVEHGVEIVREFYRKMHETRIHRLTTAGLDEDMAQKIAELHGGGGCWVSAVLDSSGSERLG